MNNDIVNRIASGIVAGKLRVTDEIRKEYSMTEEVGTLYFIKQYNLPMPFGIGDLNSLANDLANSASASLKAVKSGGKPYNVVVATNKINPLEVQYSYSFNRGFTELKAPVKFLYSNVDSEEDEPSLKEFLDSLGFNSVS